MEDTEDDDEQWHDAPADTYADLLSLSNNNGAVASDLEAFEQNAAALPPVDADDIDYSRVEAGIVEGADNRQGERQHAAAQRIQARVRGAQTRKQAQQPGGLKPNDGHHAAAAAIQARVRGAQTRKKRYNHKTFRNDYQRAQVDRSEISTAAAHLSLNRLARGSCSRRMKERKPSNTCEAGTSPGCTRAERKYT